MKQATDKDAAIEEFLTDVGLEVKRAMSKHASMHSLHEAYAVILEEMDELKAHVWKKQTERNAIEVYTEIVHIAAMCARCVADCGDQFNK